MDKLIAAFDGIRAEECLKSDTKAYLLSKISGRQKSRTMYARLAAALVVVLLFSGGYAYSLYFTPNAYVDLDVNPSVELTVNRFDRVVGTHAYNTDGIDILSELSLNHKNYEEAVLLLLDCIDQRGYMRDDGLISVTLRTDSRENEMLSELKAGVESFVRGHHGTVQADVFPVSEDTHGYAHEQDISPAKYLAIQELMAADPDASMESCKEHSIAEIKQMTRQHNANHHGNTDAAEGAESYGTAQNGKMHSDENAAYSQSNHHRNGHGGGH